MAVLKKLNEARKLFHATKIEKTGNNKFAGYKYFELGDFLIPALTIFEALDLSAVVSFGTDLATMTLTDLDDGSQFVITSPMSTAALKACHEVQNLGAVQTYLRRYLWVAALEIVEHDAVDASDGPDKNAEKPKQPDRTLVMKIRNKIQEHVTADRPLGAAEEWEAATSKGEDFAKDVWAGLTTPERDYIRQLKAHA